MSDASSAGRGRLGFGCAALYGGPFASVSAALVRAALDLGYRHFDTAPAYGLGTSEDALAAALAGRRGEVTITTKVGVPRPAVSAAALIARRVAGPLRAALPGLTRRLGRAVYAGGAAARTPLDAAAAEASLNESLRRLKTDHVDILLLHEPEPGDLGDAVLAWLEAQRRAGKALAIGVGLDAGWEAAESLIRAAPGLFDVVQCGWSMGPAVASATHAQGPRRILHGAVSRSLGRLAPALTTPPGRAALGRELGLDLSHPDDLAALLVAAAAASDPAAQVLVASRDKGRLARYWRAAHDPIWLAAGARFSQMQATASPPATGDIG